MLAGRRIGSSQWTMVHGPVTMRLLKSQKLPVWLPIIGSSCCLIIRVIAAPLRAQYPVDGVPHMKCSLDNHYCIPRYITSRITAPLFVSLVLFVILLCKALCSIVQFANSQAWNSTLPSLYKKLLVAKLRYLCFMLSMPSACRSVLCISNWGVWSYTVSCRCCECSTYNLGHQLLRQCRIRLLTTIRHYWLCIILYAALAASSSWGRKVVKQRYVSTQDSLLIVIYSTPTSPLA